MRTYMPHPSSNRLAVSVLAFTLSSILVLRSTNTCSNAAFPSSYKPIKIAAKTLAEAVDDTKGLQLTQGIAARVHFAVDLVHFHQYPEKS